MKLKIAISFLFCLLLICLFNINVFAMTFDYGEDMVTLPDFTVSDKFYIGYDGFYFLWSLDNEDSYFYMTNDNKSLYIYGSATCYYLDDETGTWVQKETWSNRICGSFSHFMCSSVDIYTDYKKEDVFFQQTSFFQGLGEIVKISKPEKAQTEILGLIPVVMIVVVFYLALRKGLQMLVIFLKTS